MRTRASVVATFFLVVVPVVVATGILATYTVGESLSPHDAVTIGFGVALLAAATACSLLLLSNPTETPRTQLGITLILCGAGCILAALALQFYLASIAADNSRRLAEMLSERIRSGGTANVNLNANIPESVKPVGYFTLLAGLWLVAVGVRLAVASAPRGGSELAPQVHFEGRETAIRADRG
jgi:hypothetical protein